MESWEEIPVCFETQNEKVSQVDGLEKFCGNEIRRFKCSLFSDKSQYKPGIILDAFDKKIAKKEDFDALGEIEFQIKNAKEEIVAETEAEIDSSSCVVFEWVIPPSTKGGEYVVQVNQREGRGMAMSELSIDILKYTPPRFKKEIIFFQNGYSEGDLVIAQLLLERAEGGFCDVEKTNIDVIARVDGKEKTGMRQNEDGKCVASFKLPESIENGVGSLNFIITEGVTESQSKTLPIILKTLKVFVYPEGGELIYGVPNGVYCSAFTPTEEPADFEAVLVEKNEKGEYFDIKTVKTLHEGRAYFDFIPRIGHEYSLRVVNPTGVKNLVKIPRIKTNGVGLFLKDKKIKRKYDQDVEVYLFAVKNRKVFIGLFKREKSISFQKVGIKKGVKNLVKLNPRNNDGVLRITVFNESKVPITERLIFVYPKDRLEFDIEVEKEIFSPGDKVKLKISSKNSRGEKIASWCSVFVTDDSVRNILEKRKRAARLPSVYFLKEEVEELNDPQSYFVFDDQDLKKIQPEVKMDLLIGTQGWRRFVYKKLSDVNEFEECISQHKPLLCVNNDVVSLSDVFEHFDYKGKVPMYDGNYPNSDYPTYIIDNGSGFVKCGVSGDDQPSSIFPSIVGRSKNPGELFILTDMCRNNGWDGQLWWDKITKGGFFRTKKRKKRKSSAPSGEKEKLSSESLGEVGESMISYVREYSHKVRKNRKVGERTDFTETLYSGIKKCEDVLAIEFDLNDAVTSFCVLIDSFTEDGIIGASETYVIKSLKPFYVEGKIPLELTFGDEVKLPVGICNNLDKELNYKVNVEGGKGFKIIDGKTTSKLESKERTGKYFHIKAINSDVIKNRLIIDAKVTNFELIDRVEKTVEIHPFGFPLSKAFSGTLKGKKTIPFEFPEDYVLGSIKTSVIVYPSPVATFDQVVRSLIRAPCGCFEQVSSTMYPMIKAIDFLKREPGGGDADLIRRANGFIESGYKKLIGYECKGGGFSVFGYEPPNEGLSAMGLLEFVDLQKVYPKVDQNMVERTKKWILSRKEKCGFTYNKKHYYGESPKKTKDAYVTYVCSKVGVNYGELEDVILKLEKDSHNDTDPYFIGMVALTLFIHGKTERSLELVRKLANYQKESGVITSSGSIFTITMSRGKNAEIETTSIGVLNFLNFKEYHDFAKLGVKYLHGNCFDGSYGTTQATILALEAKPKKGKNYVEYSVNGNVVDKVSFGDRLFSAQVLKDFSNCVRVGENRIDLTVESPSEMPYSIFMGYFSPNPVMVEHEAIKFSNKLMKTNIKEGEITEIEVELVNKEDNGIPMVVCVISVPSGLQVKFERLKELKKSRTVDYFELFSAREIAFYFERMKPKEQKKFLFFVEAVIPGKFRAQASRAYLYYDSFNKVYIQGLEVEIFPKIN